MEINTSIGDRLREERDALGKTQSDLATLAASMGVPGATRQSQAKYEKGLASPSAAYMAAMATAGVDVLYVLTGHRQGGAAAASSHPVSAGDRVLLDNFHAAPALVQAGEKTALGAFAPASGIKRAKAG